MAVDFKNSETMKNLMRAFAGESQARNRYTFAQGQAKKENLYVISEVFCFTADQEKEHAEIFYNHLKEMAGETIAIDGTYPVDITQSVIELLRYAEHISILQKLPHRKALQKLPPTFLRLQKLKRPTATASPTLPIC